MAKQPITEKITETHALTTEGFINTNDMTMEISELGIIEISEIFANFNGKHIKISIQAKEEKEVSL